MVIEGVFPPAPGHVHASPDDGDEDEWDKEWQPLPEGLNATIPRQCVDEDTRREFTTATVQETIDRTLYKADNSEELKEVLRVDEAETGNARQDPELDLIQTLTRALQDVVQYRMRLPTFNEIRRSLRRNGFGWSTSRFLTKVVMQDVWPEFHRECIDEYFTTIPRVIANSNFTEIAETTMALSMHIALRNPGGNFAEYSPVPSEGDLMITLSEIGVGVINTTLQPGLEIWHECSDSLLDNSCTIAVNGLNASTTYEICVTYIANDLFSVPVCHVQRTLGGKHSSTSFTSA